MARNILKTIAIISLLAFLTASMVFFIALCWLGHFMGMTLAIMIINAACGIVCAYGIHNIDEHNSKYHG